ncbi:nucleoside 2-deoxyribosyltransferase domain-containing protein [Calidithermus terrae]|uniref:nucleoside 2-deoxyribosyltransferase domain-containing protein n=1 Tax=Calidithermus terrae TaxID=1408545 RepID=UPI000E65C86E|nr:nucleoside 2-deoxyribosyltransferase domain-containing protein [Calidithermus terrae]
MKGKHVYLAGGFHSGWQDRVIQQAPHFSYIDPRKHNLTESSEYTAWDLFAIRLCDIFFAYLEFSNPAGYALSLELGYAKALGKLIILVDEKTPMVRSGDVRYFAMLRHAADITFDSFEKGLQFLETL